MSGQTNTFGGHSCRVVTHQIGGTPVVFLHGYSYTSEIWQRISVTKLLETEQIPFMALDMPYGAKSDCHPHSRDIEVNVAVINDACRPFSLQPPPFWWAPVSVPTWRYSSQPASTLKACC